MEMLKRDNNISGWCEGSVKAEPPPPPLSRATATTTSTPPAQYIVLSRRIIFALSLSLRETINSEFLRVSLSISALVWSTKRKKYINE